MSRVLRAIATAAAAPSRSLHARLLAAFVAVILLTLLSAGSAAVWLVQGYRTRLAVDHLAELALAATAISRQLERQDARPDEIAALVASQISATQARALVLDGDGRVVAERPVPTGGPEARFLGDRVDVPPSTLAIAAPPARTFLGVRAAAWTVRTEQAGRQYILISAATLPPPVDPRPDSGERVDRFLARQPLYRVVLAVPAQSLASAWRELAPSLASAALIAIPASVAVAWWLSRSITRRLRVITRAAEGIARGELRQSIPVRGGDEVAHLAQAFNTMSHEVEQSQQALRDFLGNASHELRTPLTSIQGFSQALVDRALPGEDGAAEAGRIINEEAERMRRLVEDLLYLSRVESRNVPASRAPVDVAGLLREGARRLSLLSQQRGLQLTLSVSDLPVVLGDADELDRLFGNLLENAGKYTPEGGTITVSARVEPTRVTVSVHNSGSYIPPEDQPRIFDRFYRMDKSRARDVEGSGLGLAIARQVAERHGGHIQVTSDPRQGTAFLVQLPLPAGETSPRHQRSERRSGAAERATASVGGVAERAAPAAP